jgi:hypothetical protein
MTRAGISAREKRETDHTICVVEALECVDAQKLVFLHCTASSLLPLLTFNLYDFDALRPFNGLKRGKYVQDSIFAEFEWRWLR